MHDDARPTPPPALLARLRADPLRAPEHLALAAAERHGPAAERWLADKHGRLAASPRDLAAMAKRRHAAYARFEGAATGIGGVVTMLPDLVTLAWIQSRLVFFVAGAYGFAPRDPMRPAELLVLQGLYATPDAARRALDGAGTPLVQAYVGSRLDRDRAIVSRLASMAGRSAARKLAGRMLPGVAIAVNAVSNERDTRRLADRAIAYYGGG